MHDFDAFSVGADGRITLVCESELQAANERIAELERLLRDSPQRKEAGARKPSTVDAATQTETSGSQQEPSESSILSRSEVSSFLVRGPKWKPDKSRCPACRGRGHTISQCSLGLEDRVNKSREFCVHGWHLPYLHGVWRCQYCCEHLQSKSVRQQQPDYYWSQAKLEWAKVQKYGTPFEGLA